MEQCVYYGEAITKAKIVHIQKSNHDSDKRVEKGGNCWGAGEQGSMYDDIGQTVHTSNRTEEKYGIET